uniref:Spermatogenesis-associated protein 6 N-terminal domain-containing protein n=1 Tax=Anser cygnoides TaxID=8845 RepID=A0A8B9DBL7_ANSCY
MSSHFQGPCSVTCLGVFLPEKHHIYLSMCIVGQHKETECLPPLFPLLFHEKVLLLTQIESYNINISEGYKV